MQKFRICMLCDRLDLGGAETHIVTLANRLAAEGHTVTLISGGGRLVEALRGVAHIRLPIFRKSAFPFLFFKLWRIFRTYRFDVVHAHTRISAFLVRPLTRGRLVCTAHWVFETTFPKKQLTVWGDETIAVSRDISAYLQKSYGCDPSHITLTINGIDATRFAPAKKEGGRVKIVCCTRMDADRADAAFALLRVARILPHARFSLCFIGDGDRFSALSKQAEALKAEHPALDITLLGGVVDVAPHLADADIFVGVSRAALEGMAAGCATILAGNEGYLSVFSPANAESAEESNFCCRGAEKLSTTLLARDLSHLLALSHSELRKMGEANRRYVCRHYSAERMASDALLVYEKICKRGMILCGYYGFRNVGDELIARALTQKLTALGYRRVRLLSKKHFSRSALRALRQGEALVLGGGTLLQDATSRRSLWFYLFCASRARGRITVCGGLGPLSAQGVRRTLPLLKRADIILCRTAGDLARIRHLGAFNAVLSCDPVLSLPFPKKEKGEYALLAFRKRKEEDFPALCAFAARAVRTFGSERVLFFVMHPDDEEMTARLSHLCGVPYRTGDQDAFLTALTHAFAVYASRLHAGICALGMGIPFYLFSGEEKCRFFVEDILTIEKDAAFCGLFELSEKPPVPMPEEEKMKRTVKMLLSRK